MKYLRPWSRIRRTRGFLNGPCDLLHVIGQLPDTVRIEVQSDVDALARIRLGGDDDVPSGGTCSGDDIVLLGVQRVAVAHGTRGGMVVAGVFYGGIPRGPVPRSRRRLSAVDWSGYSGVQDGSVRGGSARSPVSTAARRLPPLVPPPWLGRDLFPTPHAQPFRCDARAHLGETPAA